MGKGNIGGSNFEDPDNLGENHEVHKEGCQWWPENGENLGEFADCHGAVQEAENRGYSNVDGCIHWRTDYHEE